MYWGALGEKGKIKSLKKKKMKRATLSFPSDWGVVETVTKGREMKQGK